MILTSKTGVPASRDRSRQERQDTASIASELQRAIGSGSTQLVGERGREIVTAGVMSRHVFQLKSGRACRQRALPENGLLPGQLPSVVCSASFPSADRISKWMFCPSTRFAR
jgi:hypothetical protein